MLHSRIQRTVLLELVKITLLLLTGASALLMLVVAMLATAQQALDPLQVARMMPYLIPPTLPYTVPTCLLLACTIVYGGMSSSNEITALKSGGISVLSLIWPAIVLSIALAAGGVYFTNRFIPNCNERFTAALLSDPQLSLYAYLKREGSIIEPDFPYEIYVEEVRDDVLINVIFKHKRAKGGYDMVLQASEAILEVVQNDQETFVDVHLFEGVAFTGNNDVIRFKEKSQEIPMPEFVNRKQLRVANLTFEGCWRRAQEYRDDARRLELEISCQGALAVLGGDLVPLVRDFGATKPRIQRCRRKAREMDAEVHMRISKSLATIPFVLIGCPISILFRRRDFLNSFFLCFLPIIIVYYPAMILSYNVFKEGQVLSPTLLWLPMIIMVLVAIPLMRRVVRY